LIKQNDELKKQFFDNFYYKNQLKVYELINKEHIKYIECIHNNPNKNICIEILNVKLIN
jgi:hypothetical protein